MMTVGMTRVTVNVSYKAGVGYVSEANHAITRSMTAPSLKELRRKITVVALMGRKANEEISLTLLLDTAAHRRLQWGVRTAHTTTRLLRQHFRAGPHRGNSGQLRAISCLQLP